MTVKGRINKGSTPWHQQGSAVVNWELTTYNLSLKIFEIRKNSSKYRSNLILKVSKRKNNKTRSEYFRERIVVSKSHLPRRV